MLKEFKAFLLRGNIVELAVAVIVGTAFKAVVDSLVANILTPLIGIIGGKDFSEFNFTINDSTFSYGVFINDVISFIMVAAAVFFFVVKPINALTARRKRGDQAAEDEIEPSLTELLTEIRDLLATSAGR